MSNSCVLLILVLFLARHVRRTRKEVMFMEATINDLYTKLDGNDKQTVDSFILFLYDKKKNLKADETTRTIQSALRGEDIIGSFNTVDEMVEALNA